MTINNINIDEVLKDTEKLLADEKDMSSSTKSMMNLLLLIIRLLLERINVSSANSSKPPSQDPNRKKKGKKDNDEKKQGGQKGHKGKTLEKVSNPDETVELLANECKGCHNDMHFQQTDKYETRQVFEVILKRKVKEYKAEVKECDICGTVTIGEFPDGVTKAVQYGNSVKGLSVYMSQYQLIPYERVEGFFVSCLNSMVIRSFYVMEGWIAQRL